MGSTLSMVKGHSKRLLNRYNAQNKALDLIEYERLPQAPRHPSRVGAGENFHDTSIASELQSRNEKLDGYLKNIYVRSFDEPVKKRESSKSEDSKKCLPARKEVADEVMFLEPTEVPHGYCTLTQASKFMAAHDDDPLANNARTISQEYNLNEETVEHVLKYYTIFRVVNKLNEVKKKTYEQELYNSAKRSGQLKEVEEKVEKTFYLKPFSGILKSFIKENEEREKSENRLQSK